ncbi:A disintegrin and metalloproteinase with thrombospondin motif 20-like protein [Cricetulus griseus]|nr:A disintegrin and metalloproteinase with thrombospondin motif 20-like protein [Cricetulus griseus]
MNHDDCVLKQAGCDHVLNSKAKRDKCGVCGGDDSSCQTLAGVFNSAHYGKLCVLASSFPVYLSQYSALSDTQGNFLLNGNFVVSMAKKEINIQGAIFEYSGSNNSIERINSTDRLEEELVLQCSRSCGGGEKTRESYCVNGFGHRLDERECQELPPVMLGNCNEFPCPSWATSEWSECPATCGKGMKQRQVWCQLSEDRMSDGFCNASTKPESLRPCELRACASWHVGPWGSCTATCGHGYHMRAVKCVSEVFGTMLDDRECQEASRPSDRQCSVSCGRGSQARYVSCRDAHDGVADESHCAHLPRPAEVTLCFSPCGEWRAGNWSPCSRSCAGGLQHRAVVCQDEDGRSATYCDVASKPPESNRCGSGPCPHWNFGDWGECTQTCGGGIKSRFVICQFPDGQMAQEHNCELPKPPSMMQCHVHACPDDVSWYRGPWKSCSVACGSGLQRREVYCRLRGTGPVAEDMCDPATRPQEHRQCWHQDCVKYQWTAGPWLDCSVTCGNGIMERRVECRTENGWPSDLCLKRLKPDAQKKCYANDCKSLTTCKEIQVMNNITKDGDYDLNIKGRIVKIHCSGMQLENPKEYLSLVKGEDNFSEVYGLRLQNPYECPFNGSRRQDCVCKNDYLPAGYTAFSKVRVDLTSMQIKTTDLLFSKTLFGKAVPFATAGDCYSAARCPQDGTKVYGRCGGYCGKCIPHVATGLPIQTLGEMEEWCPDDTTARMLVFKTHGKAEKLMLEENDNPVRTQGTSVMIDRIPEEQLIQKGTLSETKEHWKVFKKKLVELGEDGKEEFI